MYDWTIAIRDPRSQAACVHFVPREEAERIGKQAKGLGCLVTDGPRALTARERLAAKDRWPRGEAA